MISFFFTQVSFVQVGFGQFLMDSVFLGSVLISLLISADLHIRNFGDTSNTEQAGNPKKSTLPDYLALEAKQASKLKSEHKSVQPETYINIC